MIKLHAHDKCCALEVRSAARRGRAASGLRSKGYVGLRVIYCLRVATTHLKSKPPKMASELLYMHHLVTCHMSHYLSEKNLKPRGSTGELTKKRRFAPQLNSFTKSLASVRKVLMFSEFELLIRCSDQQDLRWLLWCFLSVFQVGLRLFFKVFLGNGVGAFPSLVPARERDAGATARVRAPQAPRTRSRSHQQHFKCAALVVHNVQFCGLFSVGIFEKLFVRE